MIRRTLPVALIALGFATSGCAIAEKATEKHVYTEVEATPTPSAEINSLTGTETVLTLDQGFLGALEEADVTVEPIGSAEYAGSKATLPISGGHLIDFGAGSGVEQPVTGRVEHSQAGLRLTGGGKTVELELLTIDPGKGTATVKMILDSETVPPGITPLFNFKDGNPKLSAEGPAGAGGMTLSVPRLELEPEAASLLNEEFGTDAFEAGETAASATTDARGAATAAGASSSPTPDS